MRNNIFKIDYQIKTLKRARISSDIVNHNFLIKLSENQILNKINNFASKVEVLVELGSNSSIGEMYRKSNNCLFISIDNSIDFLKQNSSSNNNRHPGHDKVWIHYPIHTAYQECLVKLHHEILRTPFFEVPFDQLLY